MGFSEENNRIRWIDAGKAIGILLVCLGHSIQNMEYPLNKFILSFHMPLFFYFAGLTLKKVVSIADLIITIKKKMKRLLLPMFFFGILSWLMKNIYEYMTGGNIVGVSELLRECNSWFLEAMFLSTIIAIILISFTSCTVEVIVLFLLTIMFVFPINIEIDILLQTMVALIFVLGGHLSGDYITKVGGHCKGIELILIPILGLLCNFNTAVGMANNVYGNRVLFLLNALIGIFLTCLLSREFEESKIICNFIGENTLIIFGTQFTGIYIIRSIMKKVFGIYTVDTYPLFLAVFVSLIIYEAPMVYILNRIFPELWGKGKAGSRI